MPDRIADGLHQVFSSFPCDTKPIAMASESSWHPAFMPNSAPNIISTKLSDTFLEETAPGTDSHVPTHKPTHSSSESHESAAAANDLGEYQAEEASLEDNTTHPELMNLRNALTTSLASPGGVELDENPFHNGISSHDTIEEEKADFPSKGPTPPNKHLSTMSFARTAQEVNWGEDDEVDPEWNIQRTDTDPFKLMAKTDRTNSFPQVPPAHIPANAFEPLHSQVEDIMHEVEKEPKDLFGDEESNGDASFFAQEPSQFDNPSKLLPESKEEAANNDDTFGRAYGGDFQPEEEQARYEEGLPLVQSPENTNSEAKTEQASFLDEDGDDGEDFFAQVSKTEQPSEEAFPEPHPLERKSTMQVMNSLHFQPHEQTHDSIPEEPILETSHSSLERSMGGGIAGSKSTILSQVLGDPDAPIHNQSQRLEDLELLSGDGDLAAKWKAALAGDEFLEDEDDFLPDDEPTGVDSTAIDPAALFGDDDEGFLEDDEEQNPPAGVSSQVTSPPVPSPVTSSNGHVMGFDSLTGTAHTNRPSSSNRYLPSGKTSSAPVPEKLFAPSAPLLTDLSRPATKSALPSPYGAPAMGNYPVQQPQQVRPDLPKAQSFADKAKGGYSSPYDLPMDVVKPRKRVSMQQMNRGYNTAPVPTTVPPPRSSSTQLPPPSRGSTSSLSPPSSSQSFQPSQLQQGTASNDPQSANTDGKTASGFFEDLPVSSRPKPAPRHSSSLNSGTAQNQYSPQINTNAHFSGSPAQTPYTPPIQQQSFQPPVAQGLVAPDRVSPYASLPTTSMAVPVPAVSTRYSPAPPSQPSQAGPLPPVQQSRYSPAPPNPRPQISSFPSASANAPPPPILAHQPRTSSPLAHFERSQDQRSHASQVETVSFDRRSSSSTYDSSLRTNYLAPTQEVDETNVNADERRSSETQNQYSPQATTYHPTGMQPVSRTPPPPQGLAARVGNSPPKRAPTNYLPQQPTMPQSFVPPQRSQTQSPNATYARPRLEPQTSDLYQRPASVEGTNFA